MEDVLSPPLYTIDPEHLTTLRIIAPIHEACTPAEMETNLRYSFTKKYGTSMVSRLNNLIMALWTMAWGEEVFSNYRSLTGVITQSQIQVAVQKCNSANDVMPTLQKWCELDAEEGQKLDFEYDKERVRKSADLLQFAAERMLVLLKTIPGSIRDRIESVSDMVANYSRKFKFLHHIKVGNLR